MQRPIAEATFHIVLIGLVGYFLMESYSIRGSAAGGSLSPAFFPKAICVFLIVMLLVSLLTTIITSAAPRISEGPSDEDIAAPQKGSLVVSVIAWTAVLGLLVLYAFLLEPLGYVITTALMIFSMVSVLVMLNKQERKVTPKGVAGLAGFSIVTSLAIFMLFTKGFSIILPTLGIAGV
ncbi:tripartite tricarboxylate transporter TctB family protein [Halomonas hibernica]|uniref:tripartite tricarboxylate transporter TctB family protein n=1 Tax=Halomonas hibernica TaxID=2591147 RepID=UPI001553A034|nr:tripartite tricarboxylate transporter TctB family protein [Halomonas hibernica]